MHLPHPIPIAAALTLALATAAAPMAAARPTPDTKVTMSDFRWHSRPLLVFTPHDGHPLNAAQRARLAGHDGALADRDMVLVEIVGDAVAVDGAPAPGLDAAALRRRYAIADDAAEAVLVGKDGGAKLRQTHAFAAADLFVTIDAMPMRRREMHGAAQ